MTGVYCIRNVLNGKLYIGSAARNMNKRWSQHRHLLKAGTHHSHHLQAAWIFYGESSFRFGVLEICPAQQCVQQEQQWLDLFHPEYNECKVAGSPLGVRRSHQTKAKLSITHLRCNLSPEARANMSAAHRGHSLTAEHRAKIGVALRGRKLSPEHCVKIGLAHKGQIISPIQRAKISATLTGHWNGCMPPNHAGCHHSPETKAKMSIAKLGHIPSLDTRAKMSAAQKLRWKNYPESFNLNPKI